MIEYPGPKWRIFTINNAIEVRYSTKNANATPKVRTGGRQVPAGSLLLPSTGNRDACGKISIP